MNDWWESSFSEKSLSNLKLSLNHIVSNFSSNNNPNFTKVLFFSYFFTLSALLVGYFFSNIGNYLSIYWHFPVDFESGLGILNSDGIVISDSIEVLELREKRATDAKMTFFQNITLFVFCLLNFWICLKKWKLKKDYNLIYSFLIITELLTFAYGPLDFFTNDIAGGAVTPSKHYFFPVFFNILVLIIIQKLSIKIDTVKLFCIWFFSIIGINFVVWNMISFVTNDYFFQKLIIAHLCNQFVALYLINFLFDYLVIALICKYRYYNQKKSAHSLIFYFSIILVAIFSALCTFLLYNIYLDLILRATPKLASNPSLSTESIFASVKGLILTHFYRGTHTLFFYALSTLIPLLIFTANAVFIITSKTFKKILSKLMFYIYMSSNPSNVSVVPLYIIALFISFLVLIGTTHMAYVTFLGFYN